MFKASLKLAEELAKQDIRFQMNFLRGIIQGYFYSTTHKIQEI